MNPVFKFFSSIRLTLVLLVFSMMVVFFGTLDQVHWGIHEVQRRYFESLIAVWVYPQEWLGGKYLHGLAIPMPGGYLLGALLLVNLAAAHFRYFRPSWKKSGIVITHAGVVLLLISGFVISALQEESQMPIDVGSRTNYSIDFLDNELVLIDLSEPDTDTVVSIPQQLLSENAQLDTAPFPFRVTVHQYHPNALIGMASSAANSPQPTSIEASRGVAGRMGIVVQPEPVSYAQDAINTATALVEIHAEGESLGTWLVSNVFEDHFPPQLFTWQGREYEVALRFRRHYHPFWFELQEFRHDRYPGTEIPRNFSSLIRIINASQDEDRTALIYMNHPLRYAGLTFYQASFMNQDQTSVLQVVRNPGWLMPYLAVFLVGLGMTIQFTIHLVAFLRRRSA